MTGTATCESCGNPFKQIRRSARFCSSRCRLISHRSGIAGTPAAATETATGARVSVSGYPTSAPAPVFAADETLSRQRLQLDPRIVPDEHWPGMYRVRRPDGSLSDMANLTRCRDALRSLVEAPAP
jgi:endogenous inhibitor of DNA gyrase (YacG/DUF329 family)